MYIILKFSVNYPTSIDFVFLIDKTMIKEGCLIMTISRYKNVAINKLKIIEENHYVHENYFTSNI